MRAVVIAIIVGLAAFAVAAPRTGFDHAKHDKVLGKDRVDCARCHVTRGGTLVKPNHDACFGKCHTTESTTKFVPPSAAAAQKTCTTCHVGDAKTVDFPPYAAPEYQLAYGHKQHGQVACTQCHTAAKKPVHARCATCHDGKRGGPMASCAGCHTKTEHPVRTGFAPTDIVVTKAFSHGKHAVRGAAKQCATCHASLLASDSPVMARPTAQTCAIAGCHDGKPVFSPTTACTRCHQDVPTNLDFVIERPQTPYSHAKHDPRGVGGCTTCHAIAASGEILIGGHSLCTGCHDHAVDFTRRKPTICGACHNSTEPWRQLVADHAPLPRSEFGASLDHGKHAGPCTSCHSHATPTAQLRPPRGHRSCTGKGCHAKTGGPAPQLATCNGCHQLGLAEQRLAQRLAATWSVRARFDHGSHNHDQRLSRPSGRESETPDNADKRGVLACTSCHRDLGATGALAIPTPAKATCAPCHDGTVSFRLTGTSCTKCHIGKQP